MFFLTTETCVYLSWKPFFFDNQRVCSHKDNNIELPFFASEKRIFSNFDCSNMREMFGIARIQTNLNKFTVKDKATVTDMLYVSFCCKKGRLKEETEIHVIFSGETELFDKKKE